MSTFYREEINKLVGGGRYGERIQNWFQAGVAIQKPSEARGLKAMGEAAKAS